MTKFTDKMEGAGIDIEMAKGWEQELHIKLQQAKTKRDNANGTITSAQKEKTTANDEIARLKGILGITGEV